MATTTTKPELPDDLPLVLRKKRVLALVGLSATTVYWLQKRGKFPMPVKLSERATGFLTSEIRAWLAERARERAA